MDHPSFRPAEFPPSRKHEQGSMATPYATPYLPSAAQPPVHLAYADPFLPRRDPFLSNAQNTREGYGPSGKAWTSSPQGHANNGLATSQSQSLPQQSSISPAAGLVQMPPPFDSSRRRSSGGPGSPSQHHGRELGLSSSYAPRAMPPPPSPPQRMPSSSASSQHGPASRGPPTSSPFPGVRDLTSSHRPVSGMSISSILGSGEMPVAEGSWQPPRNMSPSASNPLRPPSPARARSSSFREHQRRRDDSPERARTYAEPRATSGFADRHVEARREPTYSSPLFPRESVHSFRNFQPQQHEGGSLANGNSYDRPSSQPRDFSSDRRDEETRRHDDGRFSTFRHFGESRVPPARHVESSPRVDGIPPKGRGAASLEREMFDDAARQDGLQFSTSTYANSRRDSPSAGTRNLSAHLPGKAHESIESQSSTDMARDVSRSSPLTSDLGKTEAARNGATLQDEHQRPNQMAQSRRAVEGSLQRSVFSISPELSRKGRNSPLPQAVQGVQPRHVGPGGDNPGIKIEFGRMFSGLGSGVGSTTPTPHQSGNGPYTPSRMSPMLQAENGEAVRAPTSAADENRASAKPGRGGTKRPAGPRAREGSEKVELDEQVTTTYAQRGNKRARTTHHHHHHPHSHHHHHHHHEPTEAQSGSFSMLRFPASSTANTAHASPHHHHHHTTQPLTGHHHHHHHTPRAMPMLRKPAVTVNSNKLIEECSKKPRTHLGSQLYSASTSLPNARDVLLNPETRYVTTAKSIPLFEGRENCTFTIRVPRWYFAASRSRGSESVGAFEGICRRRQVWGTDVYTDDSDVIAAAVHAGWLRGDFGEDTKDLEALVDDTRSSDDLGEEPPLSMLHPPTKPAKPLHGLDVHITVLILPALERYIGTMQNHIHSRDWQKTHDGMSYKIHRIDFVNEGVSGRSVERGPGARKARIAIEEGKRREVADILVSFAKCRVESPPTVAA